LLVALHFAAADTVSVNMDLSRFKWQNRLLMLFAPDSNHPLFVDLQREISSRPLEVRDRDLVIFEILESGSSRMNADEIGPQTAASLREQFSIPQEVFAVVLVGKDGGIKLRRNDFVSLQEIFDLIDSMPMRRQEMRQKSGG
jgi:hypothetical protein